MRPLPDDPRDIKTVTQQTISGHHWYFIDTKYHDVAQCTAHRIGGPAYVDNNPKESQWWFIGTYYNSFEKYSKVVKPYMSDEDYFIMVLTYQ